MVNEPTRSNNSKLKNLKLETSDFDKAEYLSTLKKIGPPFFYVSVLFFYFSFFLIRQFNY